MRSRFTDIATILLLLLCLAEIWQSLVAAGTEIDRNFAVFFAATRGEHQDGDIFELS